MKNKLFYIVMAVIAIGIAIKVANVNFQKHSVAQIQQLEYGEKSVGITTDTVDAFGKTIGTDSIVYTNIAVNDRILLIVKVDSTAGNKYIINIDFIDGKGIVNNIKSWFNETLSFEGITDSSGIVRVDIPMSTFKDYFNNDVNYITLHNFEYLSEGGNTKHLENINGEEADNIQIIINSPEPESRYIVYNKTILESIIPDNSPKQIDGMFVISKLNEENSQIRTTYSLF